MPDELTLDEDAWLRRKLGGPSRFAAAGRPVMSVPDTLRLYRRRSGLGLRVLAGELGVSHVTVLAWERSGDRRLVEWWEKYDPR